MKFIISILFALFFSLNLFAENLVVPEQKIVGADSPIPLGELVDLSVTDILVVPKHLVSTTYSWKVFDGYNEKRIRTYDKGVFFGAGIQNKKLKVFVVITHLYVIKEGDKFVEAATKTNFVSTDIFIGESEPEPVIPELEPEFGESKYGLSKFIYGSVKKISIPKTEKVKQCSILATSFETVSFAIAAGTIGTLEEILKKTTESNKAALSRVGGDRAKWEPTFVEIQDKLFNLYTDNKMVTKEDFSIAWKEIALGLKSVK